MLKRLEIIEDGVIRDIGLQAVKRNKYCALCENVLLSAFTIGKKTKNYWYWQQKILKNSKKSFRLIVTQIMMKVIILTLLILLTQWMCSVLSSKISTSNLKNGKLPNVISFKWAIREVSSPSRLNCGPIKRYGMILSSVNDRKKIKLLIFLWF